MFMLKQEETNRKPLENSKYDLQKNNSYDESVFKINPKADYKCLDLVELLDEEIVRCLKNL